MNLQDLKRKTPTELLAMAEELNIETGTPCCCRYEPAGPSFLMLPAGEMWSVVIESPNSAMMRAPCTDTGRCASVCSSAKPSKNGGSVM